MEDNKDLTSLNDENVVEELRGLDKEELGELKFSIPLYTQSFGGSAAVDEDGFPVVTQDNLYQFDKLQQACWRKAEKNPQINSHVRDQMGRMAGWGFEFNSMIDEVQNAIDETMEDPRNDLYQSFPKFCGRAEIEGELFLLCTLHTNGFVEVDFIAPQMVSGGGDKGSGIIYHPTKQTMPLFYLVNFEDDDTIATGERQILVPSINIAYYPELENDIKKHPSYDQKKLRHSRSNKKPYDRTAGYYRFMIYWNRGFMTRRNISHIRTTIEWVNYYEALKRYEIDHKKSSGAYLWVVTIDDIKTFKTWLNMSEEERKKTGIKQVKEPGGTIVLPPGMNMKVQNPNLPSISDQDTDIMQMVSSGLNKPQDMVLGSYNSTYASVKAAHGPQSDRVNDELAYFKRFLVYSFWRAVFFLKSKATNFKESHYIYEVVDFNKQEPEARRVLKPSYKTIDVCFPVSHLEDIEATARALLGVKHGSVVDTLGIPKSEVANRLGFSNYPTLRKMHSTEEQHYPATINSLDQESVQEKTEAEPPTKKRTRFPSSNKK